MASCIEWDSKDGRERLQRSRYAGAFYRLAHCYQPQLHPTYCAVASAVIVLNALRARSTSFRLHDGDLEVEKPDGERMRYNVYSQLHFFDECNEGIKSRTSIEGKEWKAAKDFDPGMSLAQLASHLRLQLCRVRSNPMENLSDEAVQRFRHDLMGYLNDSKSFIIVNFDGRILGKQVGGHFSPVAAYDEASDSVLVMDVASHRHAWFWAEVPDFCAAMHTRSGKAYRGWLVVQDKLQRRPLR